MGGNAQLYQNVADLMSTDLFTVSPDDPVALAAETMTWRHIRHLPVEDAAGKFVGLVSSREILKVVAEAGPTKIVRDVMDAEPATVGPEVSTVEAVRLMLDRKLDCLPVVKDGELVGLVSTQDMMVVLGCLLGAKSTAAGAGGLE